MHDADHGLETAACILRATPEHAPRAVDLPWKQIFVECCCSSSWFPGVISTGARENRGWVMRAQASHRLHVQQEYARVWRRCVFADT